MSEIVIVGAGESPAPSGETVTASEAQAIAETAATEAAQEAAQETALPIALTLELVAQQTTQAIAEAEARIMGRLSELATAAQVSDVGALLVAIAEETETADESEEIEVEPAPEEQTPENPTGDSRTWLQKIMM